ncbi:conserved hypothetical protein [Mycobacterium marinum M]|uniref:Uncharacterized protein n=1 Tax=Mycobacterium marinum (strain ATCC BAA-535 / M) TaxID=216594 RepID=B2HNR3_MYCMM|nr:conserved hypothetical protein [Mycobacterium marinum M]
MPVVAPPSPLAGGESVAGAHGSVGTTSSTSEVLPAPTGSSPLLPAMMATPAAHAVPVVSGPAVQAGPLPAYGSDLRQSGSVPPAMSSAPAAPVSGAPVAPSPSSSPSAGGPLVSPVERATSGAAAGKASASGSSMVGASALSATTGATGGAVSISCHQIHASDPRGAQRERNEGIA